MLQPNVFGLQSTTPISHVSFPCILISIVNSIALKCVCFCETTGSVPNDSTSTYVATLAHLRIALALNLVRHVVAQLFGVRKIGEGIWMESLCLF